MEDKIEVGEYVRSKGGRILHIDKVEKITKDIRTENRFWDTSQKMWGKYCDFVKHSKNIIDLIEEGDYVNGYKVLEIRKHFEVQPYRISIMVYKTKDAEFWKSLEEQDIEDIVTHEQFDSVKYITEEEKNARNRV